MVRRIMSRRTTSHQTILILISFNTLSMAETSASIVAGTVLSTVAFDLLSPAYEGLVFNADFLTAATLTNAQGTIVVSKAEFEMGELRVVAQ